jgi:tripartite-type tricarboxylate transporter receptor subunit TctC
MPLAFGVNPSIPAKTLGEFVALARAHPGKYSVGSFGSGSAGHLYMEILKDSAKIDITHVPYKGEQPALTDLIGGQISSVIISAPGAAPFANSGKLVPLAVTGSTRTQQLPNTPTFVEAGFKEPGLESTSWYGMFLPARTPKAVVDKFSRDLRTVLANPEIKRRMQEYGITMTGTTQQELAETMKADSVRWTRVIREKNIQAN